MSIVYLDGRWVEEGEARIPVMDRGFLFGDGVYTSICVEGGRACHARRHLDHLAKQCQLLGIEAPAFEETLCEELIRRNGAYEGVWKLKVLVTGGSIEEMALPRRTSGVHVAFMHRHTSLSTPLRLALFPTPFALCHAHMKSLAHLNRYYVMQYARERGFEDAVTVGVEGELLETSFGNLCWVEGGEVFFPAPELSLHWGVTVGLLEEQLQERGWRSYRVRCRLDEVGEGAAFFRVNTMGGVRPVVQVEERRFGLDAALTEQLRACLKEEGASLSVQ